MPYVVLLRHGESQWNLENRFTGWTDVDLSETGLRQASEAGQQMREAGIAVDLAFTSYLKRAIRTLWRAQDEMDLMWIPVVRDWRLNERHYGALQGENKKAFEAQYGKEQVQQWRRSYRVRPPELAPDDPRHPRFERRYRGLTWDQIPATESLADTVERVLPCWRETIKPHVRAGKHLLVSAHGNSLRALVKELDEIADNDIPGLEIPLAVPRVYEFDTDGAIRGWQYLGPRGGDGE